MSFEQLLALVVDPDLLERYGPRFLDGLLVTAKLVAISFTLGAVLGLLLALARMSRSLLLQRMGLTLATLQEHSDAVLAQLVERYLKSL